jgi:VanZ family protein
MRHGRERDMTRDDGQRAARWLLAVVTFLIIYGSLYPFRFAAVDVHGAADLLGRLHWARTTRSDIAANILLYLPFGACLGWMLAARIGGPLAALAATTIGVLLSTSIEVAQIFETRRVASLADVFFNGLGSLSGGLLALTLRSARHGFRRHAFTSVLAEPIATALLLLWLGYRLAPFALAFRPAEWAASLAPLAAGPWFAPAATLEYAILWLVVGKVLETLVPDRPLWSTLGTTMLALSAGLVLVAGKTLEPAEVIAMPLALLLTWPLSRLAARPSALLLAGLLAALIAINGLAPFDFRVDPAAFGLIPFRDSLTRYRATNLLDMFEKCFLYGSLVWLLVRAGNRSLVATLLAGTLVLGIELLQAWLPGKPADITDPLLVLAAGGLVAMFEGAGRGARHAMR